MDSGEGWRNYTSRGADQYGALLFPDDLTGSAWRNHVAKWLIERQSGISPIWESFYRFGQSVNVGEEVSWQEVGKEFGGRREFFPSGARILDLGAGQGVATDELAGIYPEVTLIGMDRRYGDELPMRTNHVNFAGGNWEQLPFADGSIDRILACESFPRWGFTGQYERDEGIFEEITRVCHPGTIWRGTMLSMPFLNQREEVVGQLTSKGWSGVARDGLFIARLSS